VKKDFPLTQIGWNFSQLFQDHKIVPPRLHTALFLTSVKMSSSRAVRSIVRFGNGYFSIHRQFLYPHVWSERMSRIIIGYVSKLQNAVRIILGTYVARSRFIFLLQIKVNAVRGRNMVSAPHAHLSYLTRTH